MMLHNAEWWKQIVDNGQEGLAMLNDGSTG